jgi:MT0933-like antitoxin protein
MGFADFADKAKALADEHEEQVDQGLDRGGDMAKERFAGHDEQIDSAVDRAQDWTGDAAPPADAPPEQ